MKKWVGWVLLAASLFVTYQGWRNSQPGPDTHELSRRAACEGKDACRVQGEDPQKALAGLIELAKHIARIEHHTGRDGPSVVT